MHARWPPREYMYTEQPYEQPTMPMAMPQVPMMGQRQQVVYMPPPYYVPPPPRYWEYAPHGQRPEYDAPRDASYQSSSSRMMIADASEGFQRLEGEVKRSVGEARLRGLSRRVHVTQKPPSGVTKTSRAWDPIELRVTDDDGVPAEYKNALLGDVMKVLEDVKSRLYSNLVPTHVAAAVGALDVLRQVLLYYQTVVAGTAEYAEPRYDSEPARALTHLLEVTAVNAKEIEDGMRKAVNKNRNVDAERKQLDETMRALLKAYKACEATGSKLKAHVDKLIADADLTA